MKTETRESMELKIAEATANALIAAGYKISVNDGEATVLKKSDDVKAIIKAMFSTDEDTLLVYCDSSVPGTGMDVVGWVRFIYGNDGWDVINDYTTNLETVLAPVDKLVKQLESSQY
ncbi:hypothetical protein ACI0X9_003319 [Cronobacter turicensis]